MKKSIIIIKCLITIFILTLILIVFQSQTYHPEINRDKHESLLPEYSKDEIIVKFKTTISDKIGAKLTCKNSRFFLKDVNKNKTGVLISKHLDELNHTFKVKEIHPVFNTLHKKMRDMQMSAYEIHRKISTKYHNRAGRRQKQKKIEYPKLESIYVFKVQAGVDIKQMARNYQNDPDVEYAEPNYSRSLHDFPLDLPNDTYIDPYQTGQWQTGAWSQDYEDLWGLKIIRADEAWKLGILGQNIVVAVVDCGVDYNHEDIRDNMWINSGEIAGNNIDDDNNGFRDDYYGFDFAYDEDNPMDISGHGTHVAGIIAATANNNRGITGVAPDARIMAIRGFDDDGIGWSNILASCIYYAADNGADIINNSWGGVGKSSMEEDAINYAESLGCITIVSAGNSNDDAFFYSPAGLKHVITVGASDHRDDRSVWELIEGSTSIKRASNYGPGVDVVAPGGGDYLKLLEFEQILSHNPDYITDYNCVFDILSLKSTISLNYSPLIIGRYLRNSGTSMATPYVCGLVALLISNNSQLDTEDIRSILRLSAFDLGTLGRDDYFGYGRIDVKAAVDLAEISVRARIFTPEVYKKVHFDETLAITGIADGSRFLNYSVVLKNIDTQVEKIIVSSSSSVTESLLASYQIQKTATPEGIYEIILKANSSTGQTLEDTTRIVVLQEKTGWPQLTTGSDFGILTYGDIDGDSQNEIIAYSGENKIYAWKINGDEVLDGDNNSNTIGVFADISSDDFGEIYNYPPALGNLDGTSNLALEIVAGTPEGVYAYKGNGQIMSGWPVQTSRNFAQGNEYPPIVISDLNNDGKDDVIAASEGDLFIWDESGRLLASYSTTGFISTIASGDLTDDGEPEIVIGIRDVEHPTSRGKVVSYNLSSGELWVWETNNYDQVANLVLGDLDTDSTTEVILCSILNNVYILDNNGETARTWNVPYFLNTQSLCLSNIDHDNNLEIIVMSLDINLNPYINVWTNTGDLYWGKNASADINPFVITDINSDDFPEIVSSLSSLSYNAGNKIYSWDMRGNMLTNWTKSLFVFRTTLYSGPTWTTLGDIDQDGSIDLLAYTGIGPDIFFLELDGLYNQGNPEWPMWRHDVQHTGRHTGSYTYDKMLGDVNSSGKVDILDALMVAQYYVGFNPVPFDVEMADVDSNGVVNIIDALQIAQVYVGLRPGFE